MPLRENLGEEVRNVNLLKTRRFLPLFITQFLGAFNDNVFKNALVMLITYKLAEKLGGNAQLLVTLAGAVFILPYFLFSATAGQLADKYDRAFIARATKIWEIVIVAIGAVGFYIGNAYFLMFVLFCLGVQSTFFGPVKYALLPQHLREDELLAGNGYIEAGTFLAILIGTISGGLLILIAAGEHLISLTMIGVAVAGYVSSRFIPKAPAPMPSLTINWNIVTETWNILQNDRKNPAVWRAILAISWFWLVGATFLAQFPTFAKDIIHSDETVVTLFLTVFSVGIGIGSMLCSKLLKGKVSAGLVPYAAFGLSLFTLDFYLAGQAVVIAGEGTLMSAAEFMSHLENMRVLADLLLIAICGGLYIVPLYAIMQHHSDPAYRARTIASNNVLNALFMVLSALATVAMLKAGMSVPQIFLAVGVANGGVGLWIYRLQRAAKAAVVQEAAFGSELYQQSLRLRDEVLRRPIGMTLREKDVATDDREYHIVAMARGKVIGCVLLRPLENGTIKLRQMAVADSHQGQGLGAKLVRHAEDIARQRGFVSVETNARKTAQGFYEKLGYAVSGEPFLEVKLHTIRMCKSL